MPVRVKTTVVMVLLMLLAGLLLQSCYFNVAPPGLTPIPTLAPAATLQAVAAVTVRPTVAGPAGGQITGDAGRGQTVYTTNCVACHGDQGQGGVGPALKGNRFVATAGDQAVWDVIAKGRPGTAMPAWLQAAGGKLSEQQVNDVTAFVRAWK